MDRFFRKLDKKLDSFVDRVNSALDDAADAMWNGDFRSGRKRNTPPPPPAAPTPPPFPGSHHPNSYDEDYDEDDYEEEEDEYEDDEEYEEDEDDDYTDDEDDEEYEDEDDEDVKPVPPPIPKRNKPSAPKPEAKPTTAPTQEVARSSTTSYLSIRMQGLIEAAVRDGVVTEAELAVLVRKGSEEGIDADELVMVVNARLFEVQQQMAAGSPKPKSTPPPLPRRKVQGKCPHCGAINPPGTAVCQECGKPMPTSNRGTDISQLQGALKLQAILDALDKDYKKGRISQRSKDLKRKIEIRNFPLPTEPKRLGEFLMLCLEQYWYPDGAVDETDVWEKRAAEGVRYAQMHHRDEQTLMEIVQETREQLDI